MTTTMPQTERPTWQLSRKSVIAIFSTLLVAIFLSSLDQTIVSTALPTIVGDLGGVSHLSWVITAYTLAITISMPIYGKLGDQFGRRSVFLIAIGLFVLGSTLSALSASMEQLIAFRAIQGLGGGGLIIGSQAILADILSPRQRAQYGGIIGAVFGVSSVLGPLLGGFLTEHASWHWAFWLNVPLGIIAFAIAFFTLKLPRLPRTHTIDYLGMSMMAPAVTSLILLTTWGGTQYAWSSPVIILLGVTFALFTSAFILVERKAAEPILPLHLFKSPTFTLAASIGLLIGAGMFAAVSYLPTYLQIVRQVGITESGLLMLPLVAGILVTSIISGRIITVTGKYKIFPVLGMALATLGVGLMSTMTATTSGFISGLYMVILGAGLGMVMQVLVLIVQNAVPARSVGVATASNNFFREIGISLGVSIFGAIFASRLSERIGQAANATNITPESIANLPGNVQTQIITSYVDALTPAFIFLVPVLALGFILALFLPQSDLSEKTGLQRAHEDIQVS